MTKDEFVEKVSKLPGVGKKKAEALYDAGYETIEKLEAATLEDLQKVEGIGPAIAKAIQEGLAEAETPADKVEVVEAAPKTKGKAAKAEKKKAEEKVEVVEAEEAYRVKIKPELPEDLTRLLAVRRMRASQEPAFARYHSWYRIAVGDAWRAPKGTLSKQRRGFKYRPPRVKVGYGKPSATRGLHPTGFEEVLVHNVDELSLIDDPKTQAARIGGTVGKRKAKMIQEAAAEKSIRILNPRRT